jgi:2-dehydro-3-deoxygalactonokinase
MTAGFFIAGDWGTTNLRLALCDARGAVISQVNGPGVAQVQGRFDSVFSELIAPWTREYGTLHAVLCGMVGSTIGWINVPYLPCPSETSQIAHSMTLIPGTRARVAPGLTCRNRHGAPDVLRGEETQILGAMRLDASLGRGQHLLCLPGTHTKWVVLRDGAIREFLTSASGELFNIVNQHSVLVRSDGQSTDDASDTFKRAVEHVQAHPQAALAHLLFECRSRQIAGELERRDAPQFLSGLLIGQDVLHALRMFADVLNEDSSIVIVGTEQLMDLHTRALSLFGRAARTVNGEAASLAGLNSLHSSLGQKD